MAKPEKGPSEGEAMDIVDSALSKLEPDARQRVIDWALSKFALQAKPPRNDGDLGKSEQHQNGKGTQATPKSAKEFVTAKKPDSFYERVACLGYYLEKFENLSEFQTSDITRVNTDARLSKMTNPALFVKHAVHTYGYLTSLGGRKFALSGRGEAVVEALPDRAKVEQAHADHSFGKRAKKGRKKKAAPTKK